MTSIAATPKPPYYAVIFSSLRTEGDNGYAAMAVKMMELAAQRPGFLGVESARDKDGLGITVSYWADLDSIRQWKQHPEHQKAQKLGLEQWYADCKTRITKVERDYSKF